jgi:hypothetical protein
VARRRTASDGLRWAWYAFTASGLVGFGSFLTYLAYGYLGSWHGIATLALLPIFLAGLARTRCLAVVSGAGWLRSPDGLAAPRLQRTGRWGLLATGGGMVAAGLVIVVLGSTEVFVAEDLAFMNLTRETLDSVNPRLIPLIAHDRAGFGGGLVTTGLLVMVSAWYARPSRSFHHAILLAGLSGFGCAIGVHFVEGYTNPQHLAPAFAGAGLFAVSVLCQAAGRRQAT